MGVLGGTFDPPHLAHLALAEAARESLNLDTVLFIPAGDPWLKSSTREITPGAYRLAMVRQAFLPAPGHQRQQVPQVAMRLGRFRPAP